MVDAFCSASCPSCYNLCHGNELPAFHSLNILSTPFVYSVPTFGWVDGLLCRSWIKSWKSWPALGWPRVLSGSEWFSSVFEGFNRNTYHLMSALSGNLKSKIHTCQVFLSDLEKGRQVFHPRWIFPRCDRALFIIHSMDVGWVPTLCQALDILMRNQQRWQARRTKAHMSLYLYQRRDRKLSSFLHLTAMWLSGQILPMRDHL